MMPGPETDAATGGCLCGAVRFRASGRLVRTEICHCATCRRSTGAAFAVFVLFRGAQVRIEGGSTTAFASSPDLRRHACRACGSPLFNRFAASQDIDVHLGAFDAPERFAPQSEIWTERRLPWLPPLVPAEGGAC
jgi:hypothetical protein